MPHLENLQPKQWETNWSHTVVVSLWTIYQTIY